MATEILALEVKEDGTRVVTRKIDGLGRAAIKADTDVVRMQKSLGQFKRALNPINAISGALAGISAALVVMKSFSIIKNFSQEMSTLSAITGATGAQFDELRDKAKELGASTRFSATQAAAGMTFLARAGFDADESITAIGSTLNLAQSGGLGLAEAADIASNVLKGFRLEADDTVRVVDTLARVANLSNTNVSQLGEAMSYVAPIAAGLGISVEETAAAIGALSDAGIQSSRAGTGLKRILTELESPSAKATAVFKDLGIRTDELQVSQVGLVAALARLRKEGITAAQSIEAFGLIAGPALEVLNNSIVNGELPITDAILNATNTAEGFAKIMDDNLNGAVLSAVSAFEALVIAFGDLGAEAKLTSFFRGLADAVRYTATNLEDLVDTGKIFFAIFAVGKIKAIYGAIQALGVRFIALNAVMALNPIGAIITAIAAATALFFYFRDEIDLGTKSFVSLKFFAIAAFQGVVEKIKPVIDGVSDLIEIVSVLTKSAFQGLNLTLGDVLTGIKSFVNLMIGAFLGGLDVVYTLFETAFLNIKALVTGGDVIGIGSMVDIMGDRLESAFNKDYVGGLISPIIAGFDELERRAALLQAQANATKALNSGAFGSPDVAVKDTGSTKIIKDDTAALKAKASAILSINEMIQEEAALLQIASPYARELKMQLISIGDELEKKGIFMDEAQLIAQFGHILRSNQLLEQRAGILDSVLGPQQEFTDQLAVITDLISNSDDFSFADGIGKINEMTGGLLDGTAEMQSTYVDQWRDTYEQIAQLRDAGLIGDKTANLLRFKADSDYVNNKLATHKEGFSALASLSSSGNSKLAAIGKAAAIANATIDTYKAATGAYASLASIPYVGPALGAAAAGAAVIAGLAQVAQIKATTTRALGGDLNAGQVSRVGEGSFARPELFTGASGNQFFIPNERGRIEPLSGSQPQGAQAAQVGPSQGGNTELNIINLLDMALFTEWSKTPEGREAIVNVIDVESSQVNQILGN